MVILLAVAGTNTVDAVVALGRGVFCRWDVSDGWLMGRPTLNPHILYSVLHLHIRPHTPPTPSIVGPFLWGRSIIDPLLNWRPDLFPCISGPFGLGWSRLEGLKGIKLNLPSMRFHSVGKKVYHGFGNRWHESRMRYR